jgi:tungstate transport system permease protein
MIEQGWRLLWSDPTLPSLIRNTLRLAFETTAIALVLGLPLAYSLATGSSRARRAGRTLANAGVGLPPVGVGVYVLLLLGFNSRSGPWLEHPWNGMVLVQTIIAVPIVVALATAAILRLPGGLVEQAQAFGAGGRRLFVFTLREARVGIIAAIVVALGSAIGEVGAVTVLVDPSNPNATLAMRVLNDESQGAFSTTAHQVEHSMVILAMLLALGLVLTIVQQSGGMRGRRPSGRRPLLEPTGGET